MTDETGAPIEFVGVGKTFPGGSKPALADLTLRIEAGELMTFVGPSGCGKTTTLRLVNRLIEPTAGTITLGDRDISAAPVEQLRRDIGYVIQQVGLFPHRTVAQNIATVPRLLRWPASEVDDRVNELVDLVGLDRDLLDRYPTALSGGQQQRVGVARALAARPSVLLMDEPYSAVDPVVRAHLQDELLALHQRVGTTIVLVTHDIDEAVRLGDRVAVFSTGQLAQLDTPDALMASPANDFVHAFLGGDRQLRRLALREVGDLPLSTIDSTLGARLSGGTAIEIDASLSGRNAIDAMLAAGVTELAVRRGDEIVGSLTLAALSALVRS